MGRLRGKIALVTGAASGIGAACAERFAKEGATIIGTDFREDVLEETMFKINEKYSTAIAYKHDVVSKDDWTNILEEVYKRFTKIDILINNAGVGATPTPLRDLTLDEWNKVININLLGTFLGTQAIEPIMIKSGGGSIINMSSYVAIVGSGVNVYTASKGGVRSLTKASAAQLGKYNIRVNSIHPGVIETPMSAQILENQDYLKATLKEIPLSRLGKPEDIVNGMLFLASDDSSYITGNELIIDGGIISH
ncbi:NAD(P)-dependent dehydrogenase, short-chain alcohol dehydrogenase family [Desulfonispora thiosulfatigenes DSM 11270]|uniref:NAD(P)-dependent dehydrogenase, short-chain alcohol dehydrogenase family n=1 Tax=Desulfonispora thiosulfatigenes DSM 11270 TaxID=656914 RepID=A0A1W1VED9_DESTI|nr:SDR family NAD(P)-dependent oxidoreductase [Desulfonispora thiosulfatigenes]SMB91314.1 NAD(P)-dependent dehydrogenase, short-chain alcohol dehydrogenase family [Desulfonispora thiosulfatigenes DSM 11270]